MEWIKPLWHRFKIRGTLMATCGVVLLASGAGLYFLGLVGDWALFGLILLCPLLHFLMMKDHSH